MVIYTVIWQWSALTGGDDGLSITRGVLDLGFASISLKSNVTFYYLVLFVVFACTLFLWRFTLSPTGAALAAVRDNPVRASAIGYNIARLKLIAFGVAGCFAGVAGSLYVLLRGFASPDLLHWSSSGQILIMAIVGGTRTLYGPAIGAALMVLVQEKLSSMTEFWMLPFGVLFVLVVRYLPGGMAQLLNMARVR
jgi:branched-chain amino acid transport system permease protein